MFHEVLIIEKFCYSYEYLCRPYLVGFLFFVMKVMDQLCIKKKRICGNEYVNYFMINIYFVQSICFMVYLPHLWVTFRLMPQVPNNILYLPLVKLHRTHFVLVATQLRLTEFEEVRLQVLRLGISELELP